MATAKETFTLERTYTVPLRKESQKAPRWKRTRKTVRALREFLQKHMKAEHIKLSKEINEKLWEHGLRNPPHHLKVTVKKDDKGVVHAELFGAVKKEKPAQKKGKGTKEAKALPPSEPPQEKE
ncbi:50S ribosomal protein L31e [Candidatus Woesearchaeota archaeon]|nr:50S ribosomal protein L31e [Candidatus Woesearchaeota archaeon]